MEPHHRRIFALLTSLVTVSLVLNAVCMAVFWPDLRPVLSHYKQRLLEVSPSHNDALNAIGEHVSAIAFFSETKKLDYVRTWVNRNSIHNIDAEHERYANKVHLVVPMLWQHHLRKANAPHLACGSRTYAMKAILERLGVESRVIDVFSIDGAKSNAISSHTFLEAWNKETKSWEIHDPDLDVSYQDRRTGWRASVFQMVMGNLNELEPVDQKGQGWHRLGRANKTFFNFAVYRLQYEGNRSIAIVNTARYGRNPTIRIGDAETNVVDYLTSKNIIVFDVSGLATRR